MNEQDILQNYSFVNIQKIINDKETLDKESEKNFIDLYNSSSIYEY